ncbi:hypothetical protein, partial [Treponema paraluiscuniculi]|uniref:hypothetical protein n=1 Tax=Treponema paraluiscuniculi TaxID=53435 RepID=UPI002FDBEC39
RLLIDDLTEMGMHALRDFAVQRGISQEDVVVMKKSELHRERRRGREREREWSSIHWFTPQLATTTGAVPV